MELLDEAWLAYREDGDMVALDFLVRRYAPLAGYLASRAMAKAPPHQELDELLSFAQDGLLDALGKYDPGQGVKFETYATRRIAGEIVDGLRRKDPLGRVQRRHVRRVADATQALWLENQTNPSVEVIGERAGLSVTDVRAAFLAQRTLNDYIDNPLHVGRFVEFGEAESSTELAEIRRIVAHRLALMTLQERAFVIAHYCEEHNVKTTSERLGISPRRCRATRADVWHRVSGKELRTMAQ